MTRTNNIYRKNAGKIIITILLAALAFIVLYPFIWMLVTSFKPEAEIVSAKAVFGKVQSGFLYQYLEAGSIFKILPQYHYFLHSSDRYIAGV